MKYTRLLATTILTASLAACGGSNTPPAIDQSPPAAPTPPPPPVDPRPDFNTEEYQLSPGLSEINAIAAYEEGYTGDGITIALLDSGIDDEHPDLKNQLHEASKDFGGNDGALFDDTKYDLSQNGGVITSVIHGTMTAGIMVAEKNDQGMHGVAPDAQVLALRMDQPEIATWGGKDINIDAVPEAIDHAIANGANVLMVEWAFWDETANQYAGPDNQIDPEFYVREDMRQSIRDAFQRAVDANMLVVIPSGNEHGTDPTAFISAMGLEDGNENGFIIVGGTDREQVIYDRSNKAGYAQDYYVVAPTRVVTTAPTRGIGEGRQPWTNSSDGTSFAGPHVAGAAALLMQAFPNLSAREVADILFSTATDLGEDGVDDIYGHGLINIEAALSPVGTPQSRTKSGAPITASSSYTLASPVFGDAFNRMGNANSIVALDKYNRAYRQNLSAGIQVRSNSPSLLSRLDTVNDLGSSSISIAGMGQLGFSYLAPARRNEHLKDALPFIAQTTSGSAQNVRFNFNRPLNPTTELSIASGTGGMGVWQNPGTVQRHSIQQHNPVDDAYAALFPSAQTFAVNHQSGETGSIGFAVSRYEGHTEPQNSPLFQNEDTRSFGANARYSWVQSNWHLGIDVGALLENGSFLGTRSSGAYAFGENSTTHYTAFTAERDLPNGWQLSARYTIGQTNADAATSSFVEDVSSIRTTAFFGKISKQQLLSDTDAFALTISQPLRAVSGHLTSLIPTAQNYQTEALQYSEIRTPLAATKQELDFELMYQFTSLNNGLRFQANALYQNNPGHQAGQAAAFLLRANLNF